MNGPRVAGANDFDWSDTKCKRKKTETLEKYQIVSGKCEARKKLQLKQFTCRPAAIIGKHKFFNNCLMVVVLDDRPNVRFAEAKTAGSTSRVMTNIHPRRRRKKHSRQANENVCFQIVNCPKNRN